MKRAVVAGYMSVLYAYAARVGCERRSYLQEHEALEDARQQSETAERITLESIELTRENLRRAVVRRRYSVVVLTGHGPGLGLLEFASKDGRWRSASALAAQLSSCCAPACILLMGCSTSELAPALRAQGLRGVSFDGPVDARGIRAFLAGFFDAYFSGLDSLGAYEQGCIAMAYDHWADMKKARWFAPGLGPEEGHYRGLDATDLDTDHFDPDEY